MSKLPDVLTEYHYSEHSFTPNLDLLTNQINVEVGARLWLWDCGDAFDRELHKVRARYKNGPQEYFCGYYRLSFGGNVWSQANNKQSYTSATSTLNTWRDRGIDKCHLEEIWLPACCFGPAQYRQLRCEMEFTKKQLIAVIMMMREGV